VAGAIAIGGGVAVAFAVTGDDTATTPGHQPDWQTLGIGPGVWTGVTRVFRVPVADAGLVVTARDADTGGEVKETVAPGTGPRTIQLDLR
jgi:hypothetical protein